MKYHQDTTDNYVVFDRLHDILAKYKQLLRTPFESSINQEPWFFGDLTGTETVGLLNGQPVGTFLVRFSAQHPHCLSAAYVDASGDITHALITKSSLGYHHADDDVYPSVQALLAAYQSVLTRPCLELEVVQQLCEEVRTQLRIFKATDEAVHDDSRDDTEVSLLLFLLAIISKVLIKRHMIGQRSIRRKEENRPQGVWGESEGYNA